MDPVFAGRLRSRVPGLLAPGLGRVAAPGVPLFGRLLKDGLVLLGRFVAPRLLLGRLAAPGFPALLGLFAICGFTFAIDDPGR